MINSDSIRSPLYPGNLTSEELMIRLANHSTLRAQHVELTLSAPHASYDTMRLRPHVFPTPSNLYLVEVHVGTPAHSRSNEIQFFVLDTGSSLVWLQCEPCVNCWSPPRARYNPVHSSSFAPIPCNHPLCELNRPDRRCVNNQCHYTHGYDSHAVTKGILATETFGFAIDGREMEFIRNIVFGCGRDNQNFRLYPQITGFMGLNMMSTSFLTQASNDLRGQCEHRRTTARVPSRNLQGKEGGEQIQRRLCHRLGDGLYHVRARGPVRARKQAFIDYFQPFGLTRSSNPKFEQSNSVNIFGTYQQRNHRISYDTRNRVLSYVPADCSADHASK
uniref:Xylanase inhibitor N-terminal domain-containing protein n=1 Tax=Ananas comosus var. bracteatus TaxID=296719 RepID=A0A6V7P736_ANACO|nr:unnamed protein product [Ananas comosus var. bracteatus]